MPEYLSIGKVSKLKKVSIKSLRYYDEIGIFRPAYINKQTNYRYYTLDQLPMLDAISLCIEMGIPLKDFEKYKDAKGNADLHRLLCDCKIMAEEKIKAMGNRLETLSHTIAELEKGHIYPSYPTKKLPPRQVLALPFDEETTPLHYTHMILKLFVTAQKLHIKATYPSGFLYEQSSKGISKYVFLMTDARQQIPSQETEACKIFHIKAGTYYYSQSVHHQIDGTMEIFKGVPELAGNYLLLETDLLSDNEENKFELQLLKKEG